MVEGAPRRVAPRPQALEHVEVLRNGRSREAVMIGRDGRALDGNPGAALELQPEASRSPHLLNLGMIAAGPEDQVETMAPEDGMRAGGTGVNAGENQ